MYRDNDEDARSQVSSVIIDYLDQDEPDFDPNDMQSSNTSAGKSLTPTNRTKLVQPIVASGATSLLGISDYCDD